MLPRLAGEYESLPRALWKKGQSPELNVGTVYASIYLDNATCLLSRMNFKNQSGQLFRYIA
jgi:hypothetical protein